MPTRGNIIMLDINPNSNRDIEAYTPDFVTGDVKTFIEWIFAHKKFCDRLQESKKDRKKWTEKIKGLIPEPREAIRNEKETEIHPGRAILELRKVADESPKTRHTVMVPDSGAHTFFTGHYWQTYAPNEFLVMTTMGPMGYSIAAGIGAKAAQRKLKQDKPVVCVIGDGGMLMHGIELQSARRNNIPLLVVVINNGALGNVYLRFRNDYKDEDGIKLTSILPRHRWDKFAESLDVRAIRVNRKAELADAYRKGFDHILTNRQPFLVDVVCDRDCQTPNMSLPPQDRKRTFRSLPVKPHVPWFG
jgi:acetolactate synthase-1/2/3 large subunit